jgi:hypothetical protein
MLVQEPDFRKNLKCPITPRTAVLLSHPCASLININVADVLVHGKPFSCATVEIDTDITSPFIDYVKDMEWLDLSEALCMRSSPKVAVNFHSSP